MGFEAIRIVPNLPLYLVGVCFEGSRAKKSEETINLGQLSPLKS